MNALELVEQYEVETPARVEDALIDAHNAPRPRFEAACIRVNTAPTLPLVDGAVVYRVGLNIPGYRNALTTTDTYEDAVQAAAGALFCGAPYADIEWVAGFTYRQEIWAEAAS